MTKTITGSLRKVTSGKSHLMKVCLNFKKEQVEELQLDVNKHVEITRNGDRFKIRFYSKPTYRSMVLSKSSTGARLMTNPKMFKIDVTEPTDTSTIVINYLEDKTGLEFDFNIDEFLKPKEERVVATVSTPQDKTDFGFEPDSAWGVKFQETVDKKIQARMREYMRSKFGMDDDS